MAIAFASPGEPLKLVKSMEGRGRTCEARLICASSESMDDVRDNSVTLTVTSPPYWNAIDYDRHAIFAETLRKTRPGGYLAVVVGTVLMNGVQYPVPFDLVSRLTRSGWQFHQDIVWHKTTAGVKRAGVFIQHPYPGYFHPNIMTEYILMFRKPGEPIYRSASAEARREAEVPVGTLFTNEIANNVWHIAPVPPGLLEHPCPFPEEIPYRLVQMFSYPGDTVLDPFLGSGQTSKVAFHLGRNAVGYDIVEKYVRYAFDRLGEPLAVRGQQLVAEFQKVPANAPRGYLGRSRKSGRPRHGSGLGGRRTSPHE